MNPGNVNEDAGILRYCGRTRKHISDTGNADIVLLSTFSAEPLALVPPMACRNYVISENDLCGAAAAAVVAALASLVSRISPNVPLYTSQFSLFPPFIRSVAVNYDKVGARRPISQHN